MDCNLSDDVPGWVSISFYRIDNVVTKTYAMEIPNSGCIVRVQTLIDDDKAIDFQVSEAVTFVPWAKIAEEQDSEGTVIGRKLINFNKF